MPFDTLLHLEESALHRVPRQFMHISMRSSQNRMQIVTLLWLHPNFVLPISLRHSPHSRPWCRSEGYPYCKSSLVDFWRSNPDTFLAIVTSSSPHYSALAVRKANDTDLQNYRAGMMAILSTSITLQRWIYAGSNTSRQVSTRHSTTLQG